MLSDPAHPELLGAYVMGILDPGEQAEIEDHLATCSICRHEIEELAGIRETLDSVPAGRVLDELAFMDALLLGDDHTDPADDLVLRRSMRQVRAESARSGRNRWLLMAAAVVAITSVAGVSGIAIGRATAPAPPAAWSGTGRTVSATDPVTGVSIKATVSGVHEWTRIAVWMKGATPGITCRLVAVGKDGRREIAASWVVDPPVAGKVPAVEGAAAIAEDNLARLEMVTDDGQRLVVVDV